MNRPVLEEELKKVDTQLTVATQKLNDDLQPSTTSNRLEDSPTQVSRKEADKKGVTRLTPQKTIGAPQKFNERFRKEYEFSEEYVEFIAHHKESPGSVIEIWTRRYGGMPAKFWIVPTGKPICAPRCVAEQIRGCKHHVMEMDAHTVTSSDGLGTYHGAITVKKEVNRLEAEPISNSISVFMPASRGVASTF